ncbi:UNVERIFIED_ORG: putative NADPH-quinone reductase [Pseudomonas reinekei]
MNCQLCAISTQGELLDYVHPNFDGMNMKTLIQVFHPDLRGSRVNCVWAELLGREPGLHVRKLYELYPDGKIDVAREQSVMEAHDRIVFQHPLYWYSVPPLMKQWLDDVLTYGWAYGSRGTALQGKEWITAISTGGSAHTYQAGGLNQFSISETLKPLQQTAHLIGMKFLPAFVFHDADQATPEQIVDSAEQMLAHVLRLDLDNGAIAAH